MASSEESFPKPKKKLFGPVVIKALIFVILVVAIGMIWWGRFSLGRDGRVQMALGIGHRVELVLTEGKQYVRLRESTKQVLESLNNQEEKKREDEGVVSEPEITDDAVKRTTLFAQEKLSQEKKLQADLNNDPVIAIIIKGLGLSSSATGRALDLPKNITLGFSPYSPSIEKWVTIARDQGNDILVNIPMETEDFRVDDPGPYALTSSSSNQDNQTRLNMLLSLFKGYVAIYSEQTEIFTQKLAHIKPVLEYLKKKNIPFIYGGEYSHSSLIQMARDITYPVLVTDVLLDDSITSDAINESFDEAEQIATDKGAAIVMAHPYPITIRMIEMWVHELEKKKIKVVPISMLMGQNHHLNPALKQSQTTVSGGSQLPESSDPTSILVSDPVPVSPEVDGSEESVN